MRGYDRPQITMLTLVIPEQRVPANHPIRLIKELAELALKELSPLFEQMYSAVGRPSIPAERLLKGSLLMALYTVRSERMLCEQLDYNLLFRWFLDLNWDGECRKFRVRESYNETRKGRRKVWRRTRKNGLPMRWWTNYWR